MPLSRLAILALMLLAPTWVGACGGQSTPGPTTRSTTSSLQRSEFVRRANALCAQHRRDRYASTTAYLSRHEDASADERIVGALQQVYIPTMDAQLADLRGLGVPSGDGTRIEAILVAFERALDGARRLKTASSTTALDKQFEKAGRLARGFGLVECTYG